MLGTQNFDEYTAVNGTFFNAHYNLITRITDTLVTVHDPAIHQPAQYALDKYLMSLYVNVGVYIGNAVMIVPNL